jgi:HK97 family phage major capsid protein
MTTPIAALDFSGVIPPEFSTQIIEEAVQQSAALQLANRVPMGTTIASMPVPKTLPRAAWVSTGGRKPYTDLKLDLETITAEEVAAVTAIPDAMLEDSAINLWAWVRPRLAEAIAVALDAAVFFGTDAPATFPAGGITAAAYSAGTDAGIDAVDGVNNAMSAVEAQGLNVTGHAADLTVKGLLRGLRDASGALLLGSTQAETGPLSTVYGVPAQFVSFEQLDPNFITGAWQNLIIGVRQDIRYELNRGAVLADNEGKVIISGFQDNVTPLKVWARFGCAVVRPVTVRQPDGAKPFATSTLAGRAGSGDAEVPGGYSAAHASKGSARKGSE